MSGARVGGSTMGTHEARLRIMSATKCGVVSHRRRRDHLGGLGATLWVMGGGEETPPSAVRPRGKGVPPSRALDISGSPHLTIGYLLMGESRVHE
jgi:hypothetical protein